MADTARSSGAMYLSPFPHHIPSQTFQKCRTADSSLEKSRVRASERSNYSAKACVDCPMPYAAADTHSTKGSEAFANRTVERALRATAPKSSGRT